MIAPGISDRKSHRWTAPNNRVETDMKYG